MVYSFARIGAALGMRVEDVFAQNRRLSAPIRASPASSAATECDPLGLMATCDDCVLCPNLSQAKAAIGIMPSENAEAEDSQRLELDRLGPVPQRQPAEFGQVLGSRYDFEEVRFANDSPVEGDGFEPSVPLEGPTRRDGFIRLSSGGSEAHHRRSAISTARSGRRSPPGP
jgi:hypothetical protein